MDAIHHTAFRDISPSSSPKVKWTERSKAFSIPALAKEDLPDPMKAVLQSFIQKGPIPDVKPKPPFKSDDGVKVNTVYTRTVMPRLRPKAQGRRRKIYGNGATRRHARVFSGEEIHTGSLRSGDFREATFKRWLAKNVLCIG